MNVTTVSQMDWMENKYDWLVGAELMDQKRESDGLCQDSKIEMKRS